MRWLSTVLMASLAGFALGARDAKAAETGAEARLRDALRSATSQLRALENERARWQATEAEQRQELEALRRQLAEAQKRSAPKAPNRCTAELKECQSDQTMLAAAAAKLRDEVGQCEASAGRGEAAARARDEERARSAGKEIAALLEQRKACEAKNARMFGVAKEILDRLWRGGTGEPLLGLKRVEIENYAQDAEDRLLGAKVKP